MASNIEFKAKLTESEFARVHREAELMSGSGPEVLRQTDTFFNVPNGRLKLRELAGECGELIAYFRPDRHQPSRSDYLRVDLPEAASWKNTFGRLLGVRGVIRKQRELFLVGNTRIHLDTVQDLGRFLEIEVVLGDGENDAAGRQVALALMSRLGIDRQWLVSAAYIDLLHDAMSDPEDSDGSKADRATP